MSNLYADAKRKARYGHTNWAVWTDKAGQQHAEKATAEVIKRAMLAIGTQGRFSIIDGSTGHGNVATWPIANNYRRWAKRYGPSTRKGTYS